MTGEQRSQHRVELRLDAPAVRDRTGKGVRIAVVDSGVHERHPHIAGVAGGIAIHPDGTTTSDYVDRLGHGTAVTAAIQEKAPEAEILAVKVFDRELSTSGGALVRAIDWAAEHGAHIVNLSLGTTNRGHSAALAEVLERAASRGCLVVSAEQDDGVNWLPGTLRACAGVVVDWTCSRDALRMRVQAGRPTLLATGFPRPIPGVPPAHNLQGISFAVANATGVLARVLQEGPAIARSTDLVDVIETLVAPDAGPGAEG